MTKEQIQAEYLKLLNKKSIEADAIIEKAKKEGKWKQGLDSNKELFEELNLKYQEKIELLKTMIDEE